MLRIQCELGSRDGTTHSGQASQKHSRPHMQPMRALSVRVAPQTPAKPAQWSNNAQPAPVWWPARPVVQQQQQQRQQYQVVPPPVAAPAQVAAMRTEDLPPWAGRFRRQLHALPQGEEALVRLLAAVDGLLVKAQHCGPHSAVLRAYITLGTIDLVAQAWQQRTAELRKAAGSKQQQQEQPPPQQQQRKAAQLEARLALAGCRYLRLEAAHELARQLHVLLDDKGHCPSLNLTNLPAPHALGLPVPSLLQQGLGLDLANPAIRGGPPSAHPKRDANAAQALSGLSWDEYEAHASDASMCGDWAFTYWHGDATFSPAPYGKFSTAELVALLTPAVVLTSLPNGIWGRALVTAAHEYGLRLDVCTSAAQQASSQAKANAAAAVAAAAGGIMPGAAVKQLLEGSMGLPAKGVRARVREFSAAVAQVRAAMLADGGSGAPEPSAQGN